MFGKIALTTVLLLALLMLSSGGTQAALVSATCNNTSTDSATLQAAINGSAVADQVQIHGPCLLNATVALKDNRSYVGDGRGATVLKQADGANLPAMLATDTWTQNFTSTNLTITVAHLTLDGNKANNATATTVPLMMRAWDSLLEDLEVENAPGDGIRWTNLSQNGTALAGTSVNNTTRDVFIHDTGGANFHVVDTGNSMTDFNLQDAWLADSGTSSDAVDLDNAAGAHLSNLHVYSVGKTAINARRCFSTRIENNLIEEFGKENLNAATYFGIRCTVQGDVANTISDNAINHYSALGAQSTYIYLGIDGVNYSTGHVAVTGNDIYGHSASAKETGLSYSKGNGAGLKVASTGNLVDNVGTARVVGAGVTLTAGL